METPRKTVLVVDDEIGYREMLQLDLTRQGYAVLTAASGPEALAVLETKHADLIVTDMKMPKMDGLMTIVEVRKRFPGMPVVLMTGYAAEDSVKKALELECTALVRKPFNIKDLNQAVHDVMH